VTVQRVFGSAGDIPVTLTVADASGNEDNFTLVVHVSPKPGQAVAFLPTYTRLFALELAMGLPAPGRVLRASRADTSARIL